MLVPSERCSIVTTFQKSSSRAKRSKLFADRKLELAEETFAREFLFIGDGQKIAEFFQCPFLISFAVAGYMIDRGLHSPNFYEMAQVHSGRILHKSVVIRI